MKWRQRCNTSPQNVRVIYLYLIKCFTSNDACLKCFLLIMLYYWERGYISCLCTLWSCKFRERGDVDITDAFGTTYQTADTSICTQYRFVMKQGSGLWRCFKKWYTMQIVFIVFWQTINTLRTISAKQYCW